MSSPTQHEHPKCSTLRRTNIASNGPPQQKSGGQPITDCDIQSCNFIYDCSSGNSWINRDIGVTTATSHELDLWGGVSLVFVRVRAVNETGAGPWSPSITPTKPDGSALKYRPDASFYIPGGHTHCYDHALIIDASASRDKDTNNPLTYQWYQNKWHQDADYTLPNATEITPTPPARNNSAPEKVWTLTGQTGATLSITDSDGLTTWSVPIPVDILGSDWPNCPHDPENIEEAEFCEPSTAVSGLTLSATDDSITAEWTAATCAPQGYYVRYREIGKGDTSDRLYTPALSRTITDLKSGTECLIRIDTLKGEGNAIQPKTWVTGRVTTTGTPPASGGSPSDCNTPTKASGLTLTAAASRLTASWTAASCAPEGYRIRWRERSGGSLNNGLKVEGATTIQITGLTNGTEYVVRLDTINANGDGIQKGTALAERGTPSS